MNKQFIFIDDSGDPGFKRASSANFVMAAMFFIDSEVVFSLSERVSEYRKSLHWQDKHEFKFTKTRKDITIQLLKIISEYDFQIYAVYIDKNSFRQTAQIIDREKLYNWMIKKLLEMAPINEAKIEIDGRSSKNDMKKTTAYIRKEINGDKTKKLQIKFVDSTEDNLIQLADLIAGAINRSLSKDKTDSKTYIDIIKTKLVRVKQLKQR